jgi:hypothetical protein
MTALARILLCRSRCRLVHHHLVVINIAWGAWRSSSNDMPLFVVAVVDLGFPAG